MNHPVTPRVVLPRALTLDQVGEMLTCDRRTIQREIQRGNLKAFRVGSLVRVTLAEVERYIGARSTAKV
jgi:DNA binding domain, excisionase family